MAGDPGVSAGFGSCLTLFLWVVSLSSPEAGLLRGQTSSYARRHDEPASAQNSVLSPAGSGIGLSRCEVAQLLCFFFLFSFGRTSFLQKDCSLWRRRLSCVKASTRLPSQNGVPVTQPLMFGQLKCFCPKAAGSKWLIHPVRFFSS